MLRIRQFVAAGVLACAGPAGAETPIRLEPLAATRPPLQTRLSSPYDADQALRTAGIARTSFDRRLQGEASTASVGFLCGMQPSTQTHGGAGALGVDTEGRFLGAQLKLGFR
jgi:hypothetical protein